LDGLDFVVLSFLRFQALMLSPLERLPVEVFDLIVANLHLPEYQTLRLASRQLRLLTFSTFTKQYFAERTTTLGSISLDRLITVASHDHLRYAVKTLHIRLLNYHDYKTLRDISRVGKFPPPKRFRRVLGVRDEHITDEAKTYEDVVKNGCPKRILNGLATALRGCSNLKTLRFRLNNADRGKPHKGDELFRAKCFQVVLEALAESKVKLEKLGTAKGKRRMIFYKSANPPYSALQLSLQTSQALQYCFSDLESLTLTVLCNCEGGARLPGWENSIGNFIANAPKLKDLALSLDPQLHLSRYEAAVIRSMATSCRIKKLECFHLIIGMLHAEDLITFLRAHGSLRQLTFSDLHLLTGTWTSIWASMKDLTELRCVRLASLSDASDYIVVSACDRPKITLDVNKDKRPMPDMLDDLIAACGFEVDLPVTTNDD
jgi:hypothetical protein